MIKVGIIGCGKIAQVRHIPEYLANPEVKLTALFDLNYERAAALAQKYGCTAYKTLDEMLGSGLDAVSVCTANVSHAQDSIKAMQHHLHVLCEKPMAVTLQECEDMIAAAKSHGVKLMIGQNQRLAQAHVKAKELIDRGALGKILTFRTTFGHGGPDTWSVDSGANTWFFDKKRSAMGAMADLGVHKTDLIQYLLGSTVKSVSARVTTLDKKDSQGNHISVDDNAICIYEMSDGAIGTMTASWTYYAKEDNSTVLYGTKGFMRIYDDACADIVLTLKSGEVDRISIGGIQTNEHQTSSGIIDAFVDCLVHDHAPLIDAISVLPAMKAVFAAIQSSKTGERIEIA